MLSTLIDDLHSPFMNNDERWEELWKKVCAMEGTLVILASKLESLSTQLSNNRPGTTPECLSHSVQLAEMRSEVKELRIFQWKSMGIVGAVMVILVPLVNHYLNNKLIGR